MRKKVLMGLGILVVALVIVACNPASTPCPTRSPCPPTPTCVDPSDLEMQLAACEATRIKAAGDARATISALQTALAKCTPCPTDTVERDKCIEKPLCHPEAISAEEAKAYVGEIKVVQGKVVDTYYCQTCTGQPTFLNLCYPYGDERRFTALVWGEDRQKFIDCLGGPPEQVLLNREVCVEGLIEIYEGIAEIILTECGQLTLIP